MGTLVFQATLGGAINLIGPNTASTVNFTLPSADGSSGQALTTNGSGTLAFGVLGILGGGTGLSSTPANGALDIGNGTGFTRTTLTAGSNITITNGAGSISIAATGGGSAATPTALGTIYGKTDTGSITFLGYQAGNASSSAAHNVAVGASAMAAITTGTRNIVLGSYAAAALTTGEGNIVLGTFGVGSGTNTFSANTSGSDNIAIGGKALNSNTTANYSIAIGANALASSTGTLNQAFGSGAGALITTGTRNIILGAYQGNTAGLDIRTASNYIVLSDGDGNPNISTADGKTVALKGAIPNTGTGITFPATQSASTDANTLDDYEEGTWTPAIGGGPSATYSSRTGTYTKIGNRVTLFFEIVVASISGTGSAWITGCPFTPSGEEGATGLILGYSGCASLTTSILGAFNADTSLYPYTQASTAKVNWDNTNLTASSRFSATIVFKV